MGVVDSVSDSIWVILKSYATTISFGDVLDIVIIAYLIYILLTAFRRTSAGGVIKGILALIAVMWAARLLRLNVINYLLMQVIQVGILLLVVLFQPELRRLLDQFGSQNLRFLEAFRTKQRTSEKAVEQVASACFELARNRTGAIIVFERTTGLGDYFASGTVINSDISSDILRNIFFPNSPLHDGAVIIRDGRVAAAGCMLPPTTSSSFSRELGSRHRAGVGISERSDGVAIIVSEETGFISVALDGMLKRNLSRENFTGILRKELIGEENGHGAKNNGLLKLRRGAKEKGNAGKD